MNFRLTAGCAALVAAGALGLMLAGCGGGSSAATSVTRAPALTGVAQAPQSQTRSVSRTPDTPDPLAPVTGATVTLVNLDDSTTANGVVGTTTTGADGSYSFPTVIPGTNYQVQAVKTIGGKTLTLTAIVTAPTPPAAGTTAPAVVPHDLNPNSTVAAVAVFAQVAALKAADPTSKHADLQALADDLVKKRVADNDPPPDCTNPSAVNSDANTLRQATAPKGSYSGLAIVTAVSAGNTNTKLGDTNQLAAQVDAAGHFFVAALSNHNQSKTTSTTGTSGSGSNSGGTTGTGTNGGGDDSNFAVGSVTTDGIVSATTKNGQIKIVGIFTAGVGSGTYQSVDGSESGTWSLTLLKSKYAGLYAGKYVSFSSGSGTGTGTGGNTGTGTGTGSGGATGNGGSTGDGTGTGTGGNTGNGSGSGGSGGLNLTISGGGVKGDFALLVLDDNSVIISGAGSATTNSIYGTGTVSATGAVTFTVSDGSVTSTGTGQIDPVAHTITGTYAIGAVEGGQFVGRSNDADTSDL